MSTRKGKSVTGILLAENIGKVVLILLLLLAVTTVVASADCEWNVTVNWCCDSYTSGWFYNNATGKWVESPSDLTTLFLLNVSGDEFYGYCLEYDVLVYKNDNFNASIYPAEASCKNNSIAYILNNWTYSCAVPDLDNVSAAQSAIWYFWYIKEDVCSLGEPAQYNHTALPNQTGWVSRWIPNCTAHPEACAFINTSINRSVPYNISITSGSGSSFPAGTPIELEATVSYCGEVEEEVTVVFETDNGNLSENGSAVYETETSNGIAQATLICDPGVDSVTVTARVKDMKWFEIVDPGTCQAKEYQGTFRFANITNNANFSFYTRKVPALSLPFIIFLAIMLSVIAISAIRRTKL